MGEGGVLIFSWPAIVCLLENVLFSYADPSKYAEIHKAGE